MRLVEAMIHLMSCSFDRPRWSGLVQNDHGIGNHKGLGSIHEVRS